MQIDFHHTVTYVVSRFAGLSHEEADIVSYCAQSVDDATDLGTVKGSRKTLLRLALETMKQSGKLPDRANYAEFNRDSDRQVLIPFHFLPGNMGIEGTPLDDTPMIERLVVRPDSFVARDMVRRCILAKGSQHDLHRLGLTMHVYVDTWAHQGFAGIIHPINGVENISLLAEGDISSARQGIADLIARKIPPHGHVAAFNYPDIPNIEWHYTDHAGKRVDRNNPQDFLTAADRMCMAIQRFIKGSPDAEVPGMNDSQKREIGERLSTFGGDEVRQRHDRWLDAIAEGEFSFGPKEVESLSYLVQIDKLKDSIRARLSEFKDMRSPDASADSFSSLDQAYRRYALKRKEKAAERKKWFNKRLPFMIEHGKLFRVAMEEHQREVIETILPSFGLDISPDAIGE